MKELFTHHIQFWVGLFGGGLAGYLYGSWVQLSLHRELQDLRAWAQSVADGKAKI